MSPVQRARGLALLSLAVLAACGGGGGYGGDANPPAPAAPPVTAKGPQSSGPVQISPDDHTVWVVNPGTDTVAAVDVAADRHQRIAEIPVGSEPRNLAISPDGKRVVVANAGADTLTVIDALTHQAIATVKVGMEPYGLAFTPNGRKLFVANARQNTVSVLDGGSYALLATLDDVGLEPRGLAITNDGDADDDDEKVYVTQFLGVDRAGVTIGSDDYKQGQVAVIASGGYAVTQAVIGPMANTGFQSDGSALKGIPNTQKVVTGAFPNMLQAIAIKGTRAYLPNTCASPDGPVRFNVNMQSCLSVLDTTTDAEGQANGASQSINMNRGVQFEAADEAVFTQRLFHAVPWAVAFKHGADEGYAVSLASNVLVKVSLDAEGTPTINAPAGAGQPSGIVRVLVGQGPRGIAINGDDTRAYVANENSRDLSVVDLATDSVIATVATATLPGAGTDDARRLIGKALFESSTGIDLPTLSSAGLSGVVAGKRLSSEGWGSCFACHGFGKTDGVVWIFASGPRRSLPLHASFNPLDPNDIKVLNYSGVNDEVQDFELNIRNVSGGLGLITQADGVTPADAATIKAVAPAPALANTGRSAALDALAFYVATGISTPRSALAAEPAGSGLGQSIARGRTLFASANCAACHGGGGWASARRDFTPPPTADLIDGSEGIAQLIDSLTDVGTFIATQPNEIRANGQPALGVKGFVPPSLLGVGALAPYLHDGSALTLDAVLGNVTHRSAGTAGVDTLVDAAGRTDLVNFLRSIDASTVPFPQGTLP
ncbi:MAG: beta-propeller fold lactonase family protein [Piscinibacter sp.]|nr:beta-propeller fold lactonase family protein [Piscinibacter sp.]